MKYSAASLNRIDLRTYVLSLILYKPRGWKFAYYPSPPENIHSNKEIPDIYSWDIYNNTSFEKHLSFQLSDDKIRTSLAIVFLNGFERTGRITRKFKTQIKIKLSLQEQIIIKPHSKIVLSIQPQKKKTCGDTVGIKVHTDFLNLTVAEMRPGHTEIHPKNLLSLKTIELPEEFWICRTDN